MFAEETKIVRLYSFDSLGIYCGNFDYKWEVGTGLAANSTLVVPLEFQEGFVRVWNGEAWQQKEDHREKTVYSTLDQTESKVDYVGKIKDEFTELKPNSHFEVWNDNDWLDLRTEEEKLAYKRSQYPKLTRYQFMRGLIEMGFKSLDIEAQILLIEDEFTRELTMIGFKDATNFVRTDPSIDVMRDLLGKTDEEIDEFWELSMTF
ncbi:hypothetical protein [uncultured Acinetobacter sp.]|uniref:hypothetical protein n=1 Tax=uncultured Acinetobacter sp. TaxID=165433 RepID=UPI0026041160|nr:hypothetical protein [uncultured Acinetobacter sp.]